jgi:hypothetical protein
MGRVAIALRLNKGVLLHNAFFRLLSFSPPFPPLRDRVQPQERDGLDYLHQIGNVWKSDQPQRYEALRDETYLRVLRITDELVRAGTRDDQSDALIRSFFGLYWGRMVALESRYSSSDRAGNPLSVETRMVQFGGILEAWAHGDPAPPSLADSRDALRAQIFAELNALKALH